MGAFTEPRDDAPVDSANTENAAWAADYLANFSRARGRVRQKSRPEPCGNSILRYRL